MKTLIVLMAFLLTSCSGVLDTLSEEIIDEIFVDYPYLKEPLEVAWEKAASIKYKQDVENYWQSPRETDHLWHGDCEDIAIFMIYHLGKEATLITGVRLSDGEQHAVVGYRGQWLGAQNVGSVYTSETFKKESELSYDAVMKISTAMFTK